MSEKKEIKGTNKRVGLFGGTFNPIHLGHLRGAEEIQEAFSLDEVIFIPSATPPHKSLEKVVEAKDRLEMVRLATSGNPRFSASDIELIRPGKSYSVDTIRYFKEKETGIIFFILGRDAFVEIQTWKDYDQLFSLCNFIVMARPGAGRIPLTSQLPKVLLPFFRHDPEVKGWVHPSGHTLCFQEITYLDISSTIIRELAEKGKSLKYLIPPEVEGYIREHDLYRKER